MILEDPNITFDSIKLASATISNNWKKFKLPNSLLRSFSLLWSERIGYRFEIGNGTNRLFTSLDNSEIICDSDLALAVCTYPLHDLLWKYKNLILDLVSTSKITSFKNDFSSKPKDINPPNWSLYESAIEQSKHHEDDKNKLKNFLRNPEKFYGIKGLSRDDFDTPALCFAIGKRVDRFSICSQIASCVTKEFHQNLLEYIKYNYSENITTVESNAALSDSLLFHSLLTKPFAILTGASGTGKTRLAERLAKCYACGDESRYTVVAVGADWTDNRHVLGFVNHLRELPLYQSTPVLDLLLNAEAHKNVPHFLVLDEMNLSHVERYFADFLSAMERPNGTFDLHGASAGDDTKLPRYEGDTLGVPGRLAFPKNLFVIGTVNVDETTYMFSPKVLDRANVIEFRMNEADLRNFLDGDGSYPDTAPANEEQAASFLATAQNKDLESLPMIKDVSGLLEEIFALMARARFEFGYRATGEVIRYLKICRTLATDKTAWDDGGWKQDFDKQILQKLLPRLHGGMGRMGPLLTGLGHFCHGAAMPAQARIDSLASLDGNTARFTKSFAKISVMAEVLREEQFVSFIC
jgi:hypothetical protein